jgi:hypothetical protein
VFEEGGGPVYPTGNLGLHPTEGYTESTELIVAWRFINRLLRMKRHLGILLQLAVLSILPVLSFWQLRNGFSLIWMPALLSAGVFLFWLGTRLRES